MTSSITYRGQLHAQVLHQLRDNKDESPSLAVHDDVPNFAALNASSQTRSQKVAVRCRVKHEVALDLQGGHATYLLQIR